MGVTPLSHLSPAEQRASDAQPSDAFQVLDWAGLYSGTGTGLAEHPTMSAWGAGDFGAENRRKVGRLA
jgi:hypothetical protein